MALTIFDTDILINIGRGDTEAINCFQTYAQTSVLAISIITQMELIVGCRDKKELQSLQSFFNQFQILELNKSISEKAVELLTQYRLSHGLLIPDALIAATAIEHNEEFITKNQKDFRFINGLKLLPYP
ncbi:MAG: type II toxin-antitoxin system VapC family toxin [Pyrinomonadaceae bacterium]|nr:type II toxin-antitoxin system VapC family toxin [Pyrinomonadaceae bacterium]